MPEKHLLSKSTFLRGLQCHKSLYLNRHQRDLRDPLDPVTEAVFKSGREVGELAHGLFPGGVAATPPNRFQFQRQVELTRDLIAGGTDVIYEAAFQHERVLALVDILVRDGAHWRVYEVKSSASLKPEHIPDAGIQAYILAGSGIGLADVSIVHINTDYVRHGELDLNRLFTIESVHPEVKLLQPEIPNLVSELKAVLAGAVIPEVEIGPHCFEPYDCDFIGYCWQHVPEVSVFNVVWLNKKKQFGLYRDGIVNIEDIPSSFLLSEAARNQVDVHKSGQPQINRDAIHGFLDTLTYPLYYLDFETFNPAIPPYDGTQPYHQIPYQYSLHRKQSPTSELEHTGFLAEATIDPRLPLIQALLRETVDPGDVIVYSGFESGIIKNLAKQFPEFAVDLVSLDGRLRDLMQPFKDRAYFTPEMQGRYSIKYVLPALVPDISYEGMAIADGGAAMRAYYELREETDSECIRQIREDLWEYCKLDSLAMVRILEKLETS